MERAAAEFLTELAVVLQKHAIYPAGHPQLEAGMEKLTRRLDALLVSHGPLSFGVARTELVIQGATVGGSNALLRELALRLHRHRIGSVAFMPGILRDELADFLTVTSVDHDTPHIALTAQAGRWPHVELTALPYSRLELVGDDGEPAEDAARPSDAKLVWLALARATDAPCADSPTDGELFDPEVLARAINARRDRATDQAVAGLLAHLAGSLRGAVGDEAAMTRTRMTELICALDQETLERLMEMGGDVQQRKRLVLDASQQLAAGAVIALVQAAAGASRQTISQTMLRLLGKLASQAEKGSTAMRAGASVALRERMEQLVDRWEMPRLNPESYQGALDDISQQRVLTRLSHRQHPCEPRRLVMTSIEADTIGPAVWVAVDQMVTLDGIAMLLDLLDRAPEGNSVTTELWPLVVTPENVRHLLRDESVDMSLLERVAARMGMGIVDLLLDALETAEARGLRRKLLDMLSRFGSAVGPLVATRLSHERPWFVQRNLLTLLAMLPELPAAIEPSDWMRHEDVRVRREALKLLLRGQHRESAIMAALRDSDDGIVQTALTAALDGCPSQAIPLIMRAIDRKSLPAEVRALGIRIVGSARVPNTLDWVLSWALAPRGILRREKLLPRSPEMLAALTGLARGWPDDTRARSVLARAGSSRDAAIRSAAATSARGKGNHD